MTTKAKKPKADTEHSFESLVTELEQIVEKLEGGEFPLEQSIALFEQGMVLAREGVKKLDAAEKKVQMLLREDGTEHTVPFTAQDEPS